MKSETVEKGKMMMRDPGILIRSAAMGLYLVLTRTALAQRCHPLTHIELDKVRDYVTSRFSSKPSGNAVVERVKENPGSCYLTVMLRLLPEDKVLVLYLTPDRRYLVPRLYDLNASLHAEDARETDEFMEPLLAGGLPSRGAENAAVSIVVFSDFECPFCKQLNDVLDRIIGSPEGEGVRIVFRNFPLKQHPWASDAAIVARCVALENNDAFWEVGNFIFSHQESLTAADLRDQVDGFLQQRGFAFGERYENCKKDPHTLDEIRQEIDLGKQYGVSQTPTMYINGMKVAGVPSADQMKRIIGAAKGGEKIGEFGSP